MKVDMEVDMAGQVSGRASPQVGWGGGGYGYMGVRSNSHLMYRPLPTRVIGTILTKGPGNICLRNLLPGI